MADAGADFDFDVRVLEVGCLDFEEAPFVARMRIWGDFEEREASESGEEDGEVGRVGERGFWVR